MKMAYDSKGDTLEHIKNVQIIMHDVIKALMNRADLHDASKLESPEKEYFDEWTPKLSGVTYGTDEYREMLRQMKPAINHHQGNNRHHPEFFPDGIAGMDIVDLVEMICDWKAATMRHNDGDILRSLEINSGRFNMAPEIIRLFKNTIYNMEW